MICIYPVSLWWSGEIWHLLIYRPEIAPLLSPFSHLPGAKEVLQTTRSAGSFLILLSKTGILDEDWEYLASLLWNVRGTHVLISPSVALY